MAFIKADIYSEMLYQNISVDLFFPSDFEEYKDTKEVNGVIYLLHGMKGNSSSWNNYTAAQRYARENNLILISPTVHNSFYADNYFGERYFTYVAEELPKKLKMIFNIPNDREKTFVAGLSMGGFGAMLLGLSRPDLFAACATFSGAVGVGQAEINNIDDPFVKRFMAPILGQDLKLREDLNLAILAKKVSELKKEEQPRILCTCGREDNLYKSNVMFKDYMKTLPLDFTYMEWTGEHNWDFWDRSLAYAIDFFLNNKFDEKCHSAWNYEVKIEKS